MCRLFPCIPIFRGVFLLKSLKKCVCGLVSKIAKMQSHRIVKNICFDVKNGISELGC